MKYRSWILKQGSQQRQGSQNNHPMSLQREFICYSNKHWTQCHHPWTQEQHKILEHVHSNLKSSLTKERF